MKNIIAGLLCILALNVGIAVAAAPAANVGDPYQILEVGLTAIGTAGEVSCDDGNTSASGIVVAFVNRGDPADEEHSVLFEAIVDGKVRSALTYDISATLPTALYNITATGQVRSIVSVPADGSRGPCDYLLEELSSK